MPDLVALSMPERLVMTDRGELVPIAELYDEWGEPTQEPRAAVSFIAGPDRNGKWWAGSVTAFENRVQH